jgi:hypothetical protein
MSDRKNFGTAEAVPSKLSPNKFGAQKICHQPLAKASGMKGLETPSVNFRR